MESLQEFLPWIFVALVAIVVFEIWSRNRGLPPGPWGFPLVGYFPFLMSDRHLKLAELSKRYGEIFCFRSVGGKLYVVLHGLPIIREVFVNRADEFIGRPLDTNYLNWMDEKLSMTNMEGDVWKEQRRFFLSAVKNYGFGKLEHEILIREVIEDMIKDMRSYGGKPFDLHGTIAHATCNMFSEILCNKRFAIDDPKLVEFRSNAKQLLSQFYESLYFAGGTVYELYLRLTPSGRSALGLNKKMCNFADEIIDEHIRTFDPNNLRDFIDSFIMHMKTLEKEGRLEKTSFSRKRLTIMFITMFIEGMETVGVALYAVLSKLAECEDVQKKLQKEVDDVVGQERLPSWSDKPKMPYTEAVLMELFRATFPFVMSTYYNNYEETTIRGYRIPKRTDIVFNIWEISNNPKNFPDPSRFDPNRFLGPNAVNYREKGPIPFGIGKRSCPGEGMAQVEAFIILGALMQNLTLYPAENGQVRVEPRDKNVSSPNQ